MNTEPTFLSMFIDFIIGTLIVVIGTGVFGLFIWFCDCFSNIKGPSFYDRYIK